MFKDLKISLVGNVDSGKSSIVGVLTRGVLDDGNGFARSHVLKHNHERVRGQTSSIGTELIGFDINGNRVIPSNPSRNMKDRKLKEYKEVSFKSHTKIILVDLCGHQKYLKTTLNGLCGNTPDYSMVIIAANSGTIPTMTLEHMNMCYVLGIPFFIVITKIDMAPENVYNETIRRVDEFLIRFKKRSEIPVPIFKVSNKTGEGIDDLISHIKSLSKQLKPIEIDSTEKVDYIIESTYQVPGIGIVVGGYLFTGSMKEGQTLLLGPNYSGEFDKIQIRSIHRQCIPSKELYKNQQSTIALKFLERKKIDKHIIRKGSRIVESPENTIEEFDANIKILKHSTSILEGYESVIHMGNITQTARIIKIYEDTVEPKLEPKLENEAGNTVGNTANTLRMGSTGKVRLKFINNKEYVKLGGIFVFREGNCRGIGNVVGF